MRVTVRYHNGRLLTTSAQDAHRLLAAGWVACADAVSRDRYEQWCARHDASPSPDSYPEQQAPAVLTAPEPAPAVFTCTGTKADGSPCTREVPDAGGRCWQHREVA